VSIARNAAILAAYRHDGRTEAELARTYGVSRQRIDQILGQARRHELELGDRRRAFERQCDTARHQLGALLAERRALNVRIRAVLADLRTAGEELEAMAVDELLRV
jgi:transposase-like protein